MQPVGWNRAVRNAAWGKFDRLAAEISAGLSGPVDAVQMVRDVRRGR
jgi:hypothetical protein